MPSPNSRMFLDPARRGYHAVYHENEVNHCPGCGRTHWIIGRTLAECGFCSTALPLSDGLRDPVVILRQRRLFGLHAKPA